MINATVIGRLTGEPEMRQVGQSSVLNFNVASDSARKDRDGNPMTTFVRVAVWGNQGTFVQKYFHKGDPIFVAGEIYSEEYTDRNGKERTTLNLNAQTISFVPQPPKARQDNGGNDNFTDNQLDNPAQPGLSEDDMPF